MPKSIGEIAASLAALDKAVQPIDKLDPGFRRDNAKAKGAHRKKQRLSSAEIEEMLLRFLKGDEEGSTSRLQAAKILLERFGTTASENDDAKKRERQERAEAEAEAQALLAELAAAKLAGVSRPRALDQDGEAGTVDAAAASGGSEE